MGLTPSHQFPSQILTDSAGDCSKHLKLHPLSILLLDPKLTPAIFPPLNTLTISVGFHTVYILFS